MIEPILTMIPGPTPVHDRILAQLARPTVSHVAPDFVADFRECLGNVARIAGTETGRPFLVAGAGTLAMEMALVNLIGTGDRLLILSQGFFGDRWAQLAEALGIDHELVQAEWGQVVPAEELARRLDAGGFAAVAMTHVDTSTGSAAPLEEYCRLLRGRDELTIVDGVCALAGMDERFDEWGIDLLLTGAQKALGTPPGLAILVASSRALDRRRGLGRVAAYYADLLRWEPIMEDPTRYFSTPPVNEIRALLEATRLVLEEGLDSRFRRHARIAEAVRAGLSAVGLEPFTGKDCLADTLSVVTYPDGVEDAAFRTAMAEGKVVVAAALGPIAGRACRVGHMGNIGAVEVARLLEAVEASLFALGRPVPPGAALKAAAPLLVT
jgi:aspartate aminotransferase-like enzyme